MKFMRSMLGGAWLGLALSLCLVACGGGGGGGGDSPPAGGNPPEGPTTSGLLPAAPAVGATLHSDATLLRPLRDQTVATYRGTELSRVPVAYYSNTVRQVADGTAVREESSNAFNDGADTGTPLFVEGGAIKQRESFRFAAQGPDEVLDVVELRSPVRSNDRYVIYDKRIANAGADYDGDRINDTLDVALWTQVAGEETLDLPRRAQVRAVRVDITLRQRVLYSTDKQLSAVAEVKVSNWYAPGLGLVKTRLDSPAESTGQPRVVIEEVLVDWDGIDQGLGRTATASPRAPAASSLAGAAVPYPLGAVAFDNHAVVMTLIPGQPPAVGFALSRLDMRGQVTASAAYRYADLGLGFGQHLKLLRVGDRLRVLVHSNNGVQMLGFDSSGQQPDAAAPVLVSETLYPNYGGSLFQAASSGNRIWLSWLNYPQSVAGNPLSQLRLQRFDADGRALGPAQELNSGVHPLTVSAVRLSSTNDRLVMSWVTGVNADLPQWRYVLADAASGNLLADQPITPLPADDVCRYSITPQALATRVAFVCSSTLASAAFALDAGNGVPRAGNGQMVLTALPPHGGAAPALGHSADNLWLLGRQYGRFWPEDSAQTSFFELAELPVQAGGFDTARQRAVMRVPGGEIDAVLMLPLGNRWLVLGADCMCEGGQLRSLLAWRGP